LVFLPFLISNLIQMKFKVINGDNFKTFIVMQNIVTKQDFEIYDIVKKVLFREEYKPFMQGFNKNKSGNYLFREYYFPLTFWKDVKTTLDKIYPNVAILENEDSIPYNNIAREDFDEWLSNLKLPETLDKTSEDYDFQRDSAYLILCNKIGKINVSMSGGKTFITYLFVRYLMDNNMVDFENNQQALIVVPTKPLANQLKNDWLEYDKYSKRKIIVETIFAGSKKILDADVVCGTFQSLGNYDDDYFSSFKIMICDELHRAKSYTIRNEIYSKVLNSEYFFGMTGTMPKYPTLDYLNITAMFGPELVSIKPIELMRRGVASTINLMIINIEYENPEYKNFSKNLKEKGIVGIDKYKEEKYFLQNLEERNSIMSKLMNNGFSGNSLVCVDTKEYTEYLVDFFKKHSPKWHYEFVHGDVKDRDEIFQEMRNNNGYFGIVGTFATMATGISINNLENIYCPDGGKSESRIAQLFGRGMRLCLPIGKTKFNYFDFQDQIPYCSFINHSNERNKIYKENEFIPNIIKIKI